jgi:thiosulfate/3-mercaptopyruvate sulfurtransferase
MKKSRVLAQGLLAAAVLAIPHVALSAEPASGRAPALLSHDELQQRLGDPKLRLIDVRPRAEYEKSHIPGAVWIDGKVFQEFSQPARFADPAAWAAVLAPLGIAPDSEVYIYDAARQHDAARVWWLLSYAGVNRVGLIDGGFPSWEKQGRPVNSEVSAIESRRFDVQLHARRATNREDVQAAIEKGTAQLLDARSEAEYRGEAKPRDGDRAGHIPTARSLDAYDLVDANGRFLDEDAQRARLTRAGVVADKPVIVYSNGGGRSALAIFAFRRLGIPARHYFPGLSGWSKNTSAPLVLGTEAGERAR